MTDRELRELVANIAVRQEHLFERAERLVTAVSLEGKETDRRLKELGKQLGGLGEKFGGFTEGMALPSMTKILRQRLGLNRVYPRASSRKHGRTMELDVLAFSDSPDADSVYVVEIKSHLREDGIQQMFRILRDLREFFPEHSDKKAYGILAAVDVPDEVAERALKEGFYLALIHDDEFEIRVPEGFQPRAF